MTHQNTLNPSAEEFVSKIDIDPKLIMFSNYLLFSTFKNTFVNFAEKILGLKNVDIKKLFVNVDMPDHFDDAYLFRTNSLWFFYKDKKTHNIVYDNGCFYEWDHYEDCDGLSCDDKQCLNNYQRWVR